MEEDEIVIEPVESVEPAAEVAEAAEVETVEDVEAPAEVASWTCTNVTCGFEISTSPCPYCGTV